MRCSPARLFVAPAKVRVNRPLAAVLTVAFVTVLTVAMSTAWTPPGASAQKSRASAPKRPPTGRAEFHRIWQVEVFDGRLDEAAEAWVGLYEACAGSQQVDRSLVGLEAALRAGTCFEKLGNDRRADLAYGWMLREFDRSFAPGSPTLARRAVRSTRFTGDVARARWLRSQATLRLRRLRAAVAPSDDPAVAAVIEEFERSGHLLAMQLERLRQEVLARRQRLAAARALAERVRSLGVDLRSSRRELGAEIDDLELPVTLRALIDVGVRQQFVIDTLTSRLVVRGLRAAAERELDRARWELDKARAMSPGVADIAVFRERLDRGGHPDQIARLARLQEAGWSRRVAAEARQRGRFMLLNADELDRHDRKLRELEKARRELEPGVGSGDPEFVELARELDSRYLLTVPLESQARVERHERTSSQDRERLLDLCEELVDLICAEALLGSARAAGRGLPRIAIVKELARLEEASGALGVDARDPENVRDQVALLGRWFPGWAGLAAETRSTAAPATTSDGNNAAPAADSGGADAPPSNR